MPYLSVCKSFEFAYAHRLPEYDGKCLRNHGHTGRIEVEVDGEYRNTYPSMVCDFYDLQSHVQPIIDKMDHKDLYDVLNETDLPENAGVRPLRRTEGKCIFPPTSENMVMWFKAQLEQAWPEVSIVRIRWWESSSSYAEWRR